jgi:sugar lactone lactonase YvrE
VVTAVIRVNVTTGQVSITPTAVSGRTVFTGPTLSLATTTLLVQAGSPGIKTMAVSISNTSDQPIGIDPNGNVTGVSVIFGTFTVTGGSSTDSVQLSNPTGIIPSTSAGTNVPYIAYPAQIAADKASPSQNWNFSVPSGVTAFSVPVTLEANNAYLSQSQSASGAGSASTYVRTFAGGPTNGYQNGSAAEALFGNFNWLAIDAAGNVYDADFYNSTIRRITPSGSVSTIAGNPYATGFVNGTGDLATFYEPAGIAITPDGSTIYVADAANNAIRRMTVVPSSDPTNAANWMVTTIAGTGSVGGGYLRSIGSEATLNNPRGIALDAGGNLYFSEYLGNRVRELSFLGGDASNAANWEVLLLAGDDSGSGGLVGSVDGNGSSATFRNPEQIATDLAGNVYVADAANHRIRKISSSGSVSTLAGGTSGSAPVTGYQDGSAATARFDDPIGIAVDASGIVYVADLANYKIRAITQAGNVSPVAGTTGGSHANGSGSVAAFVSPSNLALSTSGSLYVGDESEIRLIERINSQ